MKFANNFSREVQAECDRVVGAGFCGDLYYGVKGKFELVEVGDASEEGERFGVATEGG